MTLNELNEQRATLIDAAKNALAEMLQDSSEDKVKKYRTINETIRDIDAQIEAQQTPGKVPAPKATDMTESQLFCKRLVEAVTTSGNFNQGMPREMAKEVIKKAANLAMLRGKCRVFNTSAELSITVEAGLPTVAYVSEGGVIGDTNPTTAPVILQAHKLACIVKVSRELLKDIEFGIVEYVEDTLAEAFAAKEDTEILFGAGGVSNVEGIANKSGIFTKAAASATTVTWAEVKAAMSGIGAYRKGPNCCFVMSQKIADDIHEFRDGNGAYIFPQNEELTRIMGYPVIISDAMPTPAATKNLLFFGNFSYYALGIRENIDISTLNELYAGTDQIGVKAVERLDGKVLQAGAFATITGKAS